MPWPTEIRINKKVIQGPLEEGDSITVIVENITDEDVILPGRTVLGWLHAVDAKHHMEVKSLSLAESLSQQSLHDRDAFAESEEWDPPVDLNH